MNTCALVPSCNEAETIGRLVTAIKAQQLDIIVIDDGSTDQTAVIAQQAGADVLRHQTNQGKGAALKTGFAHALACGYQAIITMDGDGQHSTQDLPKFVEMAKNENVDIVLGNRMDAAKNMPLIRWLTNIFMSFLISLICARKIRDSQCGFRLIKARVLKKLELTCSNYEIESEMLIAATRSGFRIRSVPIQTIYAQQTSQINPIVDTFRFFKYILKSFLSHGKD
ncbi:glycosyltransferase family 2 protein [Candidatus Omnitrophota bacterium]